MATMIPRRPPEDTPNSEWRVFKCLHEQLPDHITVFHGRRFVRPQRNDERLHESEADFVVADPRRGYLVLEVKGGRVSREPDGWFSVDKQGHRHAIKDPGKQAQGVAHDLNRLLISAGRPDAQPPQYPFAWGVVLPDVVVKKDLGPDLPRDLVIDQLDLLSMREGIERIFMALCKYQGEFPSIRQNLTKALAPSFDLVPTLASRIETDRLEFVRLTDEQKRVLDILARMPRVLVQGPAGTGKTVLAMEKARRLALEGLRVLLLCYSRPLGDFLSERASGFRAMNFHAFGLEMAALAKVSRRRGVSEAEFWDQTVPEMLDLALDLCPEERWDAVIVDEGQDFHEVWWVIVQKLMKSADSGFMYVFSDPSQAVFSSDSTLALGFPAPAVLTLNCRNTARIAGFSYSRIGISPAFHEDTPQGVKVEEIYCGTEQEMARAVRKALNTYLHEGVRLPDIVVLTARDRMNSPVWASTALGDFRPVKRLADPEKKNEVLFQTIRRFKGLESDVVILCDVEDDAVPGMADRLYIGASRACHALTVIRYRHGDATSGGSHHDSVGAQS